MPRMIAMLAILLLLMGLAAVFTGGDILPGAYAGCHPCSGDTTGDTRATPLAAGSLSRSGTQAC